MLSRHFSLNFNYLHTLINASLDRLKTWLLDSSGYEAYVQRLAQGFNPLRRSGYDSRGLVSEWPGTAISTTATST
ncbi:hypothetical protein DFAR_1240013 [Desulfarculales bacterium]